MEQSIGSIAMVDNQQLWDTVEVPVGVAQTDIHLISFGAGVVFGNGSNQSVLVHDVRDWEPLPSWNDTRFLEPVKEIYRRGLCIRAELWIRICRVSHEGMLAIHQAFCPSKRMHSPGVHS